MVGLVDRPVDEPRPFLPWLAPAPPMATLLASPHASRIAAATLGAAIGDAMVLLQLAAAVPTPT